MPLIVTIAQSKGKPRDYDLEVPKDERDFKGMVTRLIRAKDKARLSSGKTQLQALLKDVKKGKQKILHKLTDKKLQEILQLIDEQLKRVTETLLEIEKETPILLQPCKTQYNIRVPKERSSLEKNIQTLGKKKDLDRLKLLQAQIGELEAAQKKLDCVVGIKKMVDDLVLALENEDHYVPYATQLDKEFLASREFKSPFYGTVEEQTAAITKYHQEGALIAYLDRSVTQKKATGEKAHQALSACFWFDVDRLEIFKNTPDLFLCCFAAIVANLYAHNASYYPAQGFGKSQQRECASPLFYYRSQQGHDQLDRIQPHNRKYYGAPNQEFKNMAIRFMGQEVKKEKGLLEALDDQGKFVSAVTGERAGGFFAHLGTRSNNANLLLGAIKKEFGEKEAEGLKQFVPKKAKAITKIKAGFGNVPASLSMLQARFVELNDAFSRKLLYKNLQTKIASYRKEQAKAILDTISAILREPTGEAYSSPLTVSYEPGTSFLNIDLFHAALHRHKEDNNYKEGLTNLLLGFFGGLLNFNAKKRGLHIATQRRQSFGFLQPTITDAGSMRIRLSFGLEPASYQAVVVETIEQFNELLKTFDFPHPEKINDETVKALVLKTKEPVERSQAGDGQPTDKTGNYWRASMRNEDDQWVALLATQKYLHEADEGNVEQAFQKYLQEFIINRCDHKKVGESDHLALRREGYSFVNEAAITLPAKASADFDEVDFMKKNPIFQVLSNLINQVVSYIATLDKLPESYSCYHLMLKLLHNCEKGEAILNNLARYETSHLHSKANLLIDNIFEYLIPLRQLLGDQQPIEELKTFETQRMAAQLELFDGQLDLYYNDSGQQANTSAMIAMMQQHPSLSKEIYFVGRSYFEVPEFCNDVGIAHKATRDRSSPFWFCDVGQLATLKELMPKVLQRNMSQLKAVIIDITHNSSAQMLLNLKGVIKALHDQGVWVVLACSTLKHEELGQDKYQFGRNVFIAPAGQTLVPTVLEELQKISQEAANPVIATFRHTVEAVVNEKMARPIVGLSKFGLFPGAKVEVDIPVPVAVDRRMHHP